MTRAAEWEGPVGSVWAAEYIRTDRSFAPLSVDLDQAIRDAAPKSGGTALDVGCGAGSTSLALARSRPDLQVIGVDVAADLIDVARERAAEIPNARFMVADLNQSAPELPPLDLIFSRHGVMFFDDPAATFTALHALAKPGAELVFSCFRAPKLNPWAGQLAATITGATAAPPAGYEPGPFAFADPAFVTPLLEQAGWQGATAEPVDYDYVAGQGDDPVADALGFFRRIGPVAAALKAAPAADHAALLAKIAPILEQHRQGDRVIFPAAAWIWRARAQERQA